MKCVIIVHIRKGKRERDKDTPHNARQYGKERQTSRKQ